MVRRSEIYWLQLGSVTGSEQAGHRPVLIIQNDIGNQHSRTTIVAAMTSQVRRSRYPFHVPFTAEEGRLRRGGTILCEQIQTIDQSRLDELAGALTSEKMEEVNLAVQHSLGLAR